MSTELPPQIQNQLAQLQQLQQQGQALISQKSQIEMMIKEIEAALKALETVADDQVIYKSAGEILLKADKAKVQEDLTEKKDVFELRLKTIAKQEERIQARFVQLQDQLKHALGQVPPRGG